MTIDDKVFRESGYREEWAEMLKRPIFQIVLELLRSNPENAPTPVPSVHYDSTCARELFTSIGINKTVKRLKELAEPWVDRTPMERAAVRGQWADFVPPELRDAVEKHLNNQQQ